MPQKRHRLKPGALGSLRQRKHLSIWPVECLLPEMQKLTVARADNAATTSTVAGSREEPETMQPSVDVASTMPAA